MNKRQKETLLEMGLSEIEIEKMLDTMRPEGIRKFHNFGEGYVDEMRRVHGLPVVREHLSLLDPEQPLEGITAEAYRKQPTTYHPQESGSVDVRITLSLSARVAQWMEGLELRLPDMYPHEPEKRELSYHVGQRLLETMRIDSERHGSLSDGGTGTMSRQDFDAMRGNGGLNASTTKISSKTYT